MDENRRDGLKSHRSIALGAAILIAATLAILANSTMQSDGRASAASGGVEMVLNIPEGLCDAPVRPTEWAVDPSHRFDVSVDAVSISAQGYIFAQAWVSYGNELGDTGANGAVEGEGVVWPDCLGITHVMTNTDQEGDSIQDSYGPGCLTALL